MITIYKDGKSTRCDLPQLDAMVAGGWTRDVPDPVDSDESEDSDDDEDEE